MALENFVIRDVVHYHNTGERGRKTSVFVSFFYLIRNNVWILLIMLAVSSGVGYVAVYLPGISGVQQSSGSSSLSAMSKGLENMSMEEKMALRI